MHEMLITKSSALIFVSIGIVAKPQKRCWQYCRCRRNIKKIWYQPQISNNFQSKLCWQCAHFQILSTFTFSLSYFTCWIWISNYYEIRNCVTNLACVSIFVLVYWTTQFTLCFWMFQINYKDWIQFHVAVISSSAVMVPVYIFRSPVMEKLTVSEQFCCLVIGQFPARFYIANSFFHIFHRCRFIGRKP